MLRATSIAILVLLVSPGVGAEIYRWVDSQGQLQFSDRPQPGAESLGTKAKETPKPTEPAALQGDEALLGPYTTFEILSPEANQTLRQEGDGLAVGLLLDPPLKPAQRLELLLDGAPLAAQGEMGTQLALSGVPLGTHSVQAQIRDADDAVVARTAIVRFHLRKPIPPGVIQ